MNKIFRVSGFDTNQDRPEVSGGFLEVFETRDVVVGAKDSQEILQRPRALRHPEDKIFFYPGIALCALLDLGQPLKIEIATGRDANDGFTPNLLRDVLEHIHGQRARRFQNDALDVEHFQHGGAKTVFVDGAKIGGIDIAQTGECPFTYLGNGGPIGEIIDMLQARGAPVLHGRHQTSAAFRLDQYQAGPIPEVAAHAGGQATTAHRHDDDVGHGFGLRLDLDPDGGLTADDIFVIEGRQEMPFDFSAVRLRRGEGVIEIIARKTDRHGIAAEFFGLADLLLRRGHRHEDDALDPEMTTHEGDALRVIAGTGANKLFGLGAVGKHLAHGIERAAQFVRPHRRQILAFQKDLGAIPIRQVIVALKRRGFEHVAHGGFGVLGKGAEIGHIP